MGKRNRERRAAKQKDRRRAHTRRDGFSGPGRGRSSGPTGHDRVGLQHVLAMMLHEAAMTTSEGDEDAPLRSGRALVAEFGAVGRDLDAAADQVLAEIVATAWAHGWLPGDVHEFARRNLEQPLVELLVGAVLAEARSYPVGTLHPQWAAALAALPDPGIADGGGALVSRFASGYGMPRADALASVVRIVALVGGLPKLEPLLPLPGQARYAGSAAPQGEVDAKALARVRALLAKAESTEFPDEAESLSAKAQELMSRYALSQAVVDHDRGRVPTAVGRRIWLEPPYAGPKALLVQAVATANRSRAVWSENLGFVTVVGGEAELASVELLVTSLLVQANRAMIAAGRHVTRSGTSRTRSFRQSFLVAYAGRIGERLQEVTDGAVAEADETGSLLPVLAARSKAADDLTATLFPTMTSRSHSVSNLAGYGAGRTAADLAQLDVRRAVGG